MSGVILVFLILFILQVATGFWWWVIVVPFFCGAFRSRTSGACVRSSSLGAGLLWFVGAVFALLTDSSRVAHQVAAMGGLESPILTVLASTIVAALTGAVAGLAGFQLKTIIGGRFHLRKVRIENILRRSFKHHDRRRTEGKDQEDRTAAIPGRKGRARLE